MNANQVKETVVAILEKHNLGGYVDVTEICERGARSWVRGTPTGAYQISVSAFQLRGTRQHLFRTNKQGAVPVEKIEGLAKAVSERQRRCAEHQAKVNANSNVAKTVREYANAQTGQYFAEWSGNSAFVVPAAEAGTVRINVGTQTLTAEQAKQVIDLLASFKKA